jgi:hypothetical protein
MVSCLVFLDSLAPSGMATQAVGKASWSMDTIGFFAQVPDQIIVDGLGAQATAFSYPMTAPARSRSRRSKDKIAMRIHRLAFRVVGPSLSSDTLTRRDNRHDRQRCANSNQQ